jgi:iron complex outermembrane receptor protein
LLFAICAGAAAQQKDQPTLSGVVRDESGGAISGASVTLREAKGKVERSVRSDAIGRFTIAGVPNGEYVLKVESATFEPFEKQVEVIDAAARVSVEVILKVAAVKQSVTVSAVSDYVQPTSATGTKLDLPSYEVPLTVDSVNRELMQDQAVRNLEQILQNVSAVSANDSVAGWGAKTYQVRGFDLYDNLLEDGVRLPAYAEVDPAIIDHVDVLKGSAGGLYGRIEPGGVINIVTLRPQANADYGGGVEFGPWGYARAELDTMGPLVPNKSLRYRFIAAYETAGSYRDNVQTRHWSILPALQWAPTENDLIDFRFEYKNWRDTADMGEPVVPVGTDAAGNFVNRLPDLPRSTYIGPSGTFYNVRTTQETLTWNHAFAPGWNVRPILVHYSVNQPGHETGPSTCAYGTGAGTWADPVPAGQDGYGSNNPTTACFYVGNPSNLGASGWFTEVDLTGHFQALKMQHNILASAEYRNQSSYYETWIYNLPEGQMSSCPQLCVNVTQPVYAPIGNYYTAPSTGSPTYGYSGGDRWGSGTLQDQFVIGKKLRVLAGVRFDAASSLSWSAPDDPVKQPTSRIGDQKFEPRVGVSYDVTRWLAAYGSFSEALGAPSYPAPLWNGTLPNAETSQQWEVGVKGHWLANRLVGEAVYFDLQKRNIVVSEPLAYFNGNCKETYTNNSCLVQVGEVGSTGVEFSLTGRLTDTLSVNLAYANISASVLDAGSQNPADAYYFPVGQKLAGVPQNSGSAWVYYRHPSGWSAGLGAIAIGTRPFDQPFTQMLTTLVLPESLQWNAVVGYEWKRERLRWHAQFRMDNFTNTNAWQAGWASSGALPSAPRAFYGTIRASFH